MNEPLIFSIQRTSYVDGPGIRTCVFMKGCNLHCLWCHNPESRAANVQILFYKDRCVSCGRCVSECAYGAIRSDFTIDAALCRTCGRCVQCCPQGARERCGQIMSVAEVMREILADKDYYGREGGATFSGGECMLYPQFLLELLRQCKEQRIHTAVDTAGDVPFARFMQIELWTDLFLYDVKAFSPALHKRLTGVSNEQILDTYKRLYAVCPDKLMVRVPVIPGWNVEEIPQIARFLGCFPPRSLELLPYHAMGVSKARALGETPFVAEVPSEELMESLRASFTREGVNCL